MPNSDPEKRRLQGIRWRKAHPYDPVKRHIAYLKYEKKTSGKKHFCKNELCKNEFNPLHISQVYCSPECRKPNMRGLVATAGRKIRQCLGCGRNFSSDGPHNRMCLDCKRKDTYGSYIEPYKTGPRRR